MGQDGEDGKDGDPDVTAEPVPPQPPAVFAPQPPAVAAPRPPAVFAPQSPVVFKREVSEAVRYERGLAVKALAMLVVVAIIVILRTLYFALPAARSASLSWAGCRSLMARRPAEPYPAGRRDIAYVNLLKQELMFPVGWIERTQCLFVGTVRGRLVPECVICAAERKCREGEGRLCVQSPAEAGDGASRIASFENDKPVGELRAGVERITPEQRLHRGERLAAVALARRVQRGGEPLLARRHWLVAERAATGRRRR